MFDLPALRIILPKSCKFKRFMTHGHSPIIHSGKKRISIMFCVKLIAGGLWNTNRLSVHQLMTLNHSCMKVLVCMGALWVLVTEFSIVFCLPLQQYDNLDNIDYCLYQLHEGRHHLNNTRLGKYTQGILSFIIRAWLKEIPPAAIFIIISN